MSRRRPAFLVSVLCALVAVALLTGGTAWPAAAVASTGTVSGIVTGAGTPLVGATVEIYRPNGTRLVTVTSGPGGAWSATVESGWIKIKAYDNCSPYGKAWYGGPDLLTATAIQLAAGGTIGPFSVDLPPVPPGTLQVGAYNWVDTFIANPGRFDVYRLNGTRVATVTTKIQAINGSVSLPPCTYRVHYTDLHHVWEPAWYAIGPPPADRVTITSGVTTSIYVGTFADETQTTLGGQVTHNGSPVPYATITFRYPDDPFNVYGTGGSLVTDAAGHWQGTGASGWPLIIRASAVINGTTTTRWYGDTDSWTTATKVLDGNHTTLDISLP